MSDETGKPQGDPTPTPQGDPAPQGATTPPPAPPTPPANEPDWKAEARKWEKLAKGDAAKLEKLQQTLSGEKESTAEQLATERARTEAAELAALKYQIAYDFGLPPSIAKRLVGANEAELKADAEELKANMKPSGQTDGKRATGTPPKPTNNANPNDLLRTLAGR